jgi:hypothetical protein
MGRRTSNVGLREPLFQIEVVDCSDGQYHQAGNAYDGHKMKQADIIHPSHRRTLFKRFRDSRAAKKWGSRFGTVISCHKVDISPYYFNIEHLNIEPITVELENNGYSLNKSLEVSRLRKRGQKRTRVEFNIDK